MKTSTIYKKSIKDVKEYPYKVLKKSTNKKLLKTVTKGRFKGYEFLTLTLIERETCPSDCYHWDDCYGNNMPFAHRFKQGKDLEKRIEKEISELNQNKNYLIRLHILGDFYSVEYVNLWLRLLDEYLNIAIYGYTGINPNSNIGKVIAFGNQKHLATNSKRFNIRYSNRPNILFSANSLEVQKPQKGKAIICPQQTGQSKGCADCALCWDTEKVSIIFKTH